MFHFKITTPIIAINRHADENSWNMNPILKVIVLYLCMPLMQCVRLRQIKISTNVDPCNPLYWYPKNIPEYCNFRTSEKPIPAMIPLPGPPPLAPIPPPLPLPPPLPGPFPPPLPAPFPPPLPAPFPPPLPAPFPPPLPLPYPQLIPAMSQPPSFMPYGLPYSNPMLPKYSPAFPPQAGMMPGLPGLVSHDGGINIMPFSDVYADVLEKHKDRMIRRKLSKILDGYKYRRLRRWK